MIFLALGNVPYSISYSVMGIILMLGKFQGNKSFRIETASPVAICCMFNFTVIVIKKLLKALATFVGSFNFSSFCLSLSLTHTLTIS